MGAMTDWNEGLARLTETFQAGIPARFDRIEQLLEASAAAPRCPEIVDALRRELHNMSGSAGSFGFLRLSTLGREGESLLLGERCSTGVDAAAIEGIARRLAAMREDLDRKTGPVVAGRPRESRGSADTGENPRVLAVEDDTDQGLLLRDVLESGGYRVRVCDDPRTFLSDVSAFRPDLVLLDVVLPGTSGFDLARTLRRDATHATLPIVFLSAQDRVTTEIAAIRSGGDAYVAKPVQPGLLLTTVTAHLERSRALIERMDRDGLTGALTRTAFLRRLDEALCGGRRRRDDAATLLLVDIDGVRGINLRHGHPTGDRVIVELASFLEANLRQSDVVGRCGADELGVLLTDTGQEDAVMLTHRLLDRFSRIVLPSPDGKGISATFSAGIVCPAAAPAGAEEWLEAAGRALATARGDGSGHVAVGGIAPKPRLRLVV
jgi:diguanylate cyclase (GGDEF)-like protein